jgi:hypothetical protein
MTGSRCTSNALLCKIVPWQEHMQRAKLKNGKQRQINRSSNPWTECKVCDLFKVGILRDKKAPTWSTDKEGRTILIIHRLDSKGEEASRWNGTPDRLQRPQVHFALYERLWKSPKLGTMSF